MGQRRACELINRNVGSAASRETQALTDGENQPDETLLISFGPALVANSLLSRAGEAYDARGRGPNRKSRFKSAFNI